MSRDREARIEHPDGRERWEIKQDIWRRDGPVCLVCGQALVWDEFELGHLHDLAMGGNNAPENLAVMCHFCNIRKPPHNSIASFWRWNRQPLRDKFGRTHPRLEKFGGSVAEILLEKIRWEKP